jgi:predicted nucleic acid-binding protein
MKIIRVYLDTSVIGGCFETKFAFASNDVIRQAIAGQIVLLISDLLIDELIKAPQHVKDLLESLPDYCLEQIQSSEESRRLRDRYLLEGFIGPASHSDAHHVALATIAGADLLLSWNFKHLVHYVKIKAFSGVNLLEGYPLLEIRTPWEIVLDDKTQEP